MEYRTCPDCMKAKVVLIRIDTFSKYFVDHLVECPKCGWFGVETEDKEDFEPVQLKLELE